MDAGALNSVTRGLVGDTSFAVLPEVTKELTFILTFLFQLVCVPRPVPLAFSNICLDSSRQGLVQPRLLGYLCRCDHPLRLCIIPLRLACA